MSTSESAAPVSRRTRILADVCLFGVATIWGVNIPLMKTGVDELDRYVFNAIRLTISAAVLAGFAGWERARGTVSKPGISRVALFIYAVLAAGMYQVLFLLGISNTTSGNTALIISTVPIWTALMAWLFLGERLRSLAWCGLVVALIGTMIVAFQKGDVTTNHEHLWGNMFMIGAALTWSGGTVYSRRLLKYISPMKLAAIAAVVSLPVHYIVTMGKGFDSQQEVLQSMQVWIIIAYAGVLSSGLALPMWNYGVRHAGAAHAAIIQNVIPLVAIVAAWFSRSEVPTRWQVTGGVLILIGLVVMRSARGNAPKELPSKAEHAIDSSEVPEESSEPVNAVKG